MTPPSTRTPVAVSAISYPAHAPRCVSGDYLLHREDDGRVRVYRVENLVQLSRMVPFGQGDLIEEQAVVDSRRPAFSGEVHVLLTAFSRTFATSEEAVSAVSEGNLGVQTEGLIRNIERFAERDTVVHRVKR